jgi:hypothetical protein
MWNVNTKKMCRQHLLGEHKELHQAVGSLRKGRSLEGHIKKGQLEIHNIRARHVQLVQEMKARGYKHNSPLKSFDSKKSGKINKKANERELAKRCKNCKFKK